MTQWGLNLVVLQSNGYVIVEKYPFPSYEHVKPKQGTTNIGIIVRPQNGFANRFHSLAQREAQQWVAGDMAKAQRENAELRL